VARKGTKGCRAGYCAAGRLLRISNTKLDSLNERPGDRADLVDVLALAVLYSRLCSDDAPFDRKAMRLVLDIHHRVSFQLSMKL